MDDRNATVVRAQMLIRKPVAEVFEALVNPAITTRFWFTNSTGRLEPGATVRWDWQMFGVSDSLTVKEFEPNRRVLMAWASDPTLVEWRFEARGEGATLVEVSNWGFPGASEEVLPQAVDAKGGYTLVLAGMKAWLEHGIALDLVRDQFPDALQGESR